jgi:acetyl esterase
MDDQLRPQLAGWLNHYNTKMGRLPAAAAPTPASVRDGLTRLSRNLLTEIPPLALIVDAAINGTDGPIPLRIYHPAPDETLPVLIYLHGGGHVSGSLAVFDPICRKIALAARRLVIGVDYRLAPENPYPAALHDATAVLAGYGELLQRLGLHHVPDLALAGDSAGGALAATLVHRNPVGAIDHLALIYPLLDYTLSQPSMELFARGHLLEKSRILWALDRYFQGGEDRRAASPLFMDIPPSFPRTYIATAGCCPLRDEARCYGERLRAHGAEVVGQHFPGMVHAFLHLETLIAADCRQLYTTLGLFLQRRT